MFKDISKEQKLRLRSHLPINHNPKEKYSILLLLEYIIYKIHILKERAVQVKGWNKLSGNVSDKF